MSNHKRFSVLLAYPDWMCDGGAVDTFYHFVRAPDPDTAVGKARHAAAKQNEMEDGSGFTELLVLSGHKKAIR